MEYCRVCKSFRVEAYTIGDEHRWWYSHYAVREITKSSSTFYATDISCNIVWFLTLHDNFVWNFIFGTKFSSIYLIKSEKRLVFRRLFVNRQRAKDGTHVFDAKYRYVFVV